MANSVTSNTNFVELTSITSDYDHGKKAAWDYFKFVPGKAADACVIKDGDATGPVIFDAKAAAASDEQIVYYHGQYIQPFVDVSSGTYNSSSRTHRVILALWREK